MAVLIFQATSCGIIKCQHRKSENMVKFIFNALEAVLQKPYEHAQGNYYNKMYQVQLTSKL